MELWTFDVDGATLIESSTSKARGRAKRVKAGRLQADELPRPAWKQVPERPQGLREKVLRAFGAGDLYDRLARLSSEVAEAQRLLAETVAERSNILYQLTTLQEEAATERDTLHRECGSLK